MKSRSSNRWLYLFIGTALGGAATLGVIYLWTRPIFVFLEHEPYLSAASQGQLDVAVLRLLRNGDVSGATDLMEHRLSMVEATLSGYEATFEPQARDELVLTGSEKIREYRDQFPRP